MTLQPLPSPDVPPGSLGIGSAIGHGETYSGEGSLKAELLRLDFVGQLLRGKLPKVPHVTRVADLPTASDQWQYAIGIVSTGAAPDIAYICLLTAAPSTYAWVVVSSPVPTGAIIMWAGTIAAIPGGWHLCDGTSGTPDLINRFVKGVATASTNPGATGGSPSHTHTGHSDHAFTHESSHVFSLVTATANATIGGPTGSGQSSSATTHDHGYSGTFTHTGGGVNAHSAHDAPNSEPPYYALAYIMKL